MGILALAADERVADVKITEDELSVRLWDGRTISVPLIWYPRLLNATDEQRKNWRIIGGGYGIHWEDVDEDLSTEGLLRGAPAPRQTLAKTTLVPPHPKHQASLDNDSAASTTESLGSANGKSIMDHAVSVREAAGELQAIMETMGEAARELGVRMQQHSAATQSTDESPQSVAEAAQKTILLSLPDMDNFSARIEGMLPRLEEVIQLLEDNFSAIVSLANPKSKDDISKVVILQNTISGILTGLSQPKAAAIQFRDVTIYLIAKQPPAEVIESSKRQAEALNKVLSNIEEIESFALRVMYQINRKFGQAMPLHEENR
jgi:hypothetical protein